MSPKTTEKPIGRPPRHGGYSLMIRAGVLPERRAYLREYLTQTREGLVNDLGPLEADLNAAQVVLIDRVISKLSILRCIEEHVREKGVFTKSGELDSVLSKSYLALANSIRLDLQALGIDKRAGEKIMSPLEIAAEIDRGKAARGEGGTGEDAEVVEKMRATHSGEDIQGNGEGDGDIPDDGEGTT